MRPEICVVPLAAVESILVDDASLRVLCLFSSGTLSSQYGGEYGYDNRNHELQERSGYDPQVIEVAIERLKLAGFLLEFDNGGYEVVLARPADWQMPATIPPMPGEDIETVSAAVVAEAERSKGESEVHTERQDALNLLVRRVVNAVQQLLHTYENLGHDHYAAREIAEAIDLLQPGAIAEAWPPRPQIAEPPVKAKQPRRTAISVSTRYRILKRDNFKCVYCGRNASEVAIQIDHYTPVSAGGSSDDSNLRSACYECNAGKGATPP